MNDETKAAVTKALDAAIVRAAEEYFNMLRGGLEQQEIADEIRCALRSLDRLRRGRMPSYDAWDALFYCLWYQPAHINLAYTLARQVPDDKNPLRSGGGSLQVFDFGCGALAMQFGLALAAADVLQEQGTLPTISIISGDDSESMKEIGRRTWHFFVSEVSGKEKYPELDALSRVLPAIEFEDQGDSEATCWLTALHVAYREYFYKAKIDQGLGELVQKHDPSVVLITTHPQNIQSAYSPGVSIYEKHEEVLRNPNYVLYHTFPETTRFRRSLYEQFIDSFNDMNFRDQNFVRTYLTNYSTAWVPDTGFDSHSILYTKR